MGRTAYERLLEKLPEIAEAVKSLPTSGLQERAFDALARSLLSERDAGGSAADRSEAERGASEKAKGSKRGPTKMAKRGDASKRKRARRGGVTVERGLDFRPEGAPTFKQFAEQKSPADLNQKHTIAVFYLKEVMKVGQVGVGHVLAAFREAGWKPAAHPGAALRKTASVKGWIDTADSEDIGLTPAANISSNTNFGAKRKAIAPRSLADRP